MNIASLARRLDRLERQRRQRGVATIEVVYLADWRDRTPHPDDVRFTWRRGDGVGIFERFLQLTGGVE